MREQPGAPRAWTIACLTVVWSLGVAGCGDGAASTDESDSAAIAADAADPDAAAHDATDATDAEGTADAGAVDTATSDTATSDTATSDAAAADSAVTDTAPLDSGPGETAEDDAAEGDVPPDDTLLTDALLTDAPVTEVSAADAAQDDSAGETTGSDVEAAGADGNGSEDGESEAPDATGGPDGSDDASVLDPTCPYDPKVICLHWGVCKGAKVKVSCPAGLPECTYDFVPGYEEVEKSCDGLDNDCNALTDDDLPEPLAQKQAGVCLGARAVCGGASGWQEPDYTQLPGYEALETACDGLDNDCDGDVDLFTSPKKLQGVHGVCAEASYVCAGKAGWQWPQSYWGIPFWQPVETMCDDLDNDCDGLTDEDMVVGNFIGSGVTVNSLGVCFGAPIQCLDGVWSPPDYSQQPAWQAEETLCDGLDNDCDGDVDEMPAGPASKQAGVCKGALQACHGTDGWQDPDWTALPGYGDIEWHCDGVDNDCDGLTDEDAACPLWQIGGRGAGWVDLSPDGQHLAWTQATGVQVLGWQDGAIEREWHQHLAEVTGVRFAPDGELLASTAAGPAGLQVWPLAAPATPDAIETAKFAPAALTQPLTSLQFSDNGALLAVGDVSGTIHVFAVWSGYEISQLHGPAAAVTALVWLPDDATQTGRLLSGDANGAIHRWQAVEGTGQQVALVQGAVRAMAVRPLGTTVAVVAASQGLVLDGASGAPIGQLPAPKQAWADVALRIDGGTQLLLLETDGTVRVVPVADAVDEFVTLTPTAALAPPAETAGDVAVRLSARAGHVAVGFRAEGPWRLDLAGQAWSRAAARHRGPVRDAAVSGGLLLTTGDDWSVRAWRHATAESLFALWGHGAPVLAVAPVTALPTAPADASLAQLLGSGFLLATGSQDFTVRFWTVTPTAGGGVAVVSPKIFGLGGPWPTDLARGTDALWAAGGPTLGKYAIDPQKLGQKLNAYPTKLGNVIERVVPSPDGAWLALGMSGDGSGSDVHYRVLDAKTLLPKLEWKAMAAPTHVLAWSADGTHLALAADAGGTIAVAEVQSGAVIQLLHGHDAALTGLGWSASGQLLSTGADGKAVVWRPGGDGLLQQAVFRRHSPQSWPQANAVLGGTWLESPDHRVVTFGADGSIIAWKAPASP